MVITASGAQPAGTVGPAWADTSAKTETVLNPLRLQDHVRRTVGVYVPGVTAVTAHARYYSLHPWLAAYAAATGRSRADFLELVRRCEVVIAWASYNHKDHLADLPVAHGRDAVLRHVSGDMLDIAAAARRGQYSASDAGFLGTAYRNPETSLGVFDSDWRAGPRFTPAARAGLDAHLSDLIDTALADTLTAATASDGADAGWCICQARRGEEGAWLRELFAGSLPGPPALKATDLTRRHTIRLLARAMVSFAEHDVPSGATVLTGYTGDVAADDPEAILRTALLFSGSLDTLPAAAGLVEYAEKWRGLLLRHYTVTAWRRLWANIVNTISGVGRTARDIGELIGGSCPDSTVGDFVSHSDTVGGDHLIAAEEAAWAADSGPGGDVAVLCISAQRTTQVTPTALQVLCWDDRSELGPGWIAAQIAAEKDKPLREWVATLCRLLLARAQRVGLDKFRVDETDGRAILPAQVAERDGYWHKINEVGTSPLGLRVTSLATVLAGAGILDHSDGSWNVTSDGHHLGLT